MPHVQHDYFSSFNQSDHCLWPCLCRCRRAFTIWMEFPVEWTNGTALLLSKEMDRIEPYHLILSFDISVRGPGAILHFFSEMLTQKAWRQVIDKWWEIFGNSGWFGNISEGITFFPGKKVHRNEPYHLDSHRNNRFFQANGQCSSSLLKLSNIFRSMYVSIFAWALVLCQWILFIPGSVYENEVWVSTLNSAVSRVVFQ